jgi:lipoyl(octanoyl) transferase
MTPNKEVYFQDLGLIDYKTCWDYQEHLLADTVAQKMNPVAAKPTPNHLLFCEHPHVFTLGKSGKPHHLLANDALLERIGAQYYPINRGGDITYHGPGQLVGYPIFDLDNFFTDIHRYMRTLEEAVIRTCAEYHLDAGRIEGLTGVWLDYTTQQNSRKICAMGVKASRWVTMHGLALNVNTDLSYFGYIVPCGIQDKAVTSIAQELGHPVAMQDVAAHLIKHLSTLFEAHIVEKSPSLV